MGAVIVRNPQPAPFSDKRNGPPNRKVSRWSRHSSNRRKASFYALFPSIVTLILSLTAFPLSAQSPLGILAPKAKPSPAQQTASPTPAPAPNSNSCDPFAGVGESGRGTGTHVARYFQDSSTCSGRASYGS